MVHTRPAVCARALLVFLSACAFSTVLNAGRSSENSSQWVLIVLDLSCRGNGYKSGARATPVDDRRRGTAIWLNPGVVPSPTPAVGHRPVHINGRICFGSATPTCVGDQKSLEASGRRFEVEVARVGAPGGKKVTRSLFRHEYLLLVFFVLCLPCVLVMVNHSWEMMCGEHVVCTCSG